MKEDLSLSERVVLSCMLKDSINSYVSTSNSTNNEDVKEYCEKRIEEFLIIMKKLGVLKENEM